VMVVRLVKPALRLLPGQVACMSASCRFRMTWRFAPSCASVVMPELCAWAPRTSRSQTCHARRRLVVRGWSEMQPSSLGLGVLLVRVLTKICMPSLRRNSK
jgi:hypothetical protein